jgi:type IX secretion system PorP/SprF family membrane protein
LSGKMKKLAIILMSSAGSVFSQDIHFSQFQENPSLLNPALCGAEYLRRFSANYKDQWGSVTLPYRSYGVSFESRLHSSNWQQVDNFRRMTFKKRSLSRLTAGMSIYNDQAGDGKLGQTLVNGTLATFIKIDQESYLSVGLQGSLVQRRLNASKLKFPDQFEETGFNPTIDANENLSGNNFTYGDLATGVLWYYGEHRHVVQVEQMLKAKVGISFYHLLSPEQKFMNYSPELLYRKIVFHGDLTFGIRGTSSAFSPSWVLSRQGPSTEFIFGGMIKTFSNDNSIYTGLVKRSCYGYGIYYRNKDALIISAMLDRQQHLCFLLSYDINISPLRNASAFRGGIEFTIRITSVADYLYQKKEVPN